MNQEKVGKFIKDIRKKNNLTQQAFAQKYGITYQAVSKWENGKNLPDMSLIKQICKDYNIDINDLLDGEYKKNNKKPFIYIGIILILLFIIGLVLYFTKDNSFEFKTLSSSCDNFEISGSISYNDKKTSILISEVDYCGEKINEKYKKIECGLYEKYQNKETLIGTTSYSGNDYVKLEDYLEDVVLTIDDYDRTCKEYSDQTLFLRINALDEDDKNIVYTIPISIDKCN